MAFVITGATLGLTVQQWCDRLREELLDQDDRVELDKLDGAMTTGDTVMTTTYASGGLRAQTRVEVGGEVMHVWGAGSTAKTYLVERGFDGSVAGTRADGSLVRVGPRFTTPTLAEQLRRELRSWPDSVYAIASAEFSVTANQEAIDLDGLSASDDVRRLLRVQHDHVRSADTSWPTIQAFLERRQNVTAFPSGYALRFPRPVGKATTVRVVIGYRFPTGVAAIDPGDDIGETFHLTAAQADIAMVGVAARLLTFREVARTDDRSQQRFRRGEDVPPGHQLQTGQALTAERNRLLAAESMRLLNEYPMERA